MRPAEISLFNTARDIEWSCGNTGQQYWEVTLTTLPEVTIKRAGPYRDNLAKRVANYVPLSPLSFLPKAAAVHPNRIAIIHGAWRSTWAETYVRCKRLASALAKHGVGAGDTVAVMAQNVP